MHNSIRVVIGDGDIRVGNRVKVVDGNGNTTPDPTDGTTTLAYDPADRL